MSDAARKRTIADWVVKTKKQVVKLYAITKWARDAETVQKCMVIGSRIFNDTRIHTKPEYNRLSHESKPTIRERHRWSHLCEGKSRSRKVRLLISSCFVIVQQLTRLRNHDLLTSLDVLTSGTYTRLPFGIKVALCLPVLSQWTHVTECRNLLFPFLP